MLSLCMIARDEAMLIGQCLDSVKDLVDEMIVVDTGSIDATAEIATSIGAKVIPFTWNDDFSAARNEALLHARGDWILVLDADEYLAPGGAEVIRLAMEQNKIGVGMLPLHNAATLDAQAGDVLSGQKRLGEPVRLARLLKRTPSLKWKGMFHEHVGDWVLEEKLVVSELDAPLIHFGNVPELRENRDKEGRNARLLKAYCDAEPNNLRALCNYLKVLMRVGSPDQIREIADRAWSILKEQEASGIKLDPFAVTMAGCQRAEFLKSQGALDEAMETLQRAIAWGIRDSCLFLIQGTVFEQAAIKSSEQEKKSFLMRARDSYATCLTFNGQISTLDNYPGATSWAAHLRLGYTCLRLEEYATATEHFKAVHKTLPELNMAHVNAAWQQACVGMIAAMSDGGSGSEAHKAARSQMRQFKGPDLWAMAADAAEQAGDFHTFLSMMRRTDAHLKKGTFQTNLARERYAAALYLLQLYQGKAATFSGSTGIVGGLIAGRANLEDKDEVSQPDQGRIQRLLVFLKKERQEDFENLRKNSVMLPKFNGVLTHLIHNIDN